MTAPSLRGKRYFLTPVCLVPNGRAHLGHIAGPLLKMDVLRRHLRRAGADVCMVSLSDAHESHVPIKAYQEGSTPAEVANRFHRLIRADLAALRIEYDDLVDPLDPAWSATYESVNRDFLDRIVRAGNATVRAEPMPVLDTAEGAPGADEPLRPRVGDPVVSGWLKGRCPHCDQPLVGFFCESCGGHFAPSEMRDPGTAHFAGTLRFEELRSLWLDLRDGPGAVLDHLRRIRVRPDFVAIAERYLAANGAAIRLSVPNPWGLAVDHPGVSPRQVIFSYSALLIGCHLVAGERYRQLTGAELNPFDAGSDVTCLLSFGIDNAVPFLVGAVGCALGQGRYRPVDGFLVNYFYDLDGSKFSTSRGHVVWGGDIVGLAGAEADLVRAYLCLCNPEFGRRSFQPDEFLLFHNEFGARVSTAVSAVAATARDAKALDDGVARYLDLELRTQADLLAPETFDLRGAFGCVERWLDRTPALAATPDAALTWLTGFALLAWPVLPEAAERVWSMLGRTGTPALDALDAAPVLPDPAAVDVEVARYRTLTRAELNACLPARLRR